jgi:3-carboxy-cis,cis-muconate cycloisomerase
MPARLIDSFGATGALAEVFSDQAVLAAMLRFETALAQSQAALGIIPQRAAGAIAKVKAIPAGSLAEDARRNATLAIPFAKALKEQAGAAAAEWVHWGATSQDVLDTALVLLLRDARRILAKDHTRLARGLRALSEQHPDTVMMARTLLQPAIPITFGYKAAGWFGAVNRSWRRVSAAFDEALQLQFGGAAGTLAAYGDQGLKLAAGLAKRLELPLPDAPWHAHRDRLASLVTQLGIYAGCLAKIARDIALLMQAEVGEVSEPGGASSAMPEKRNPAGSVVALAAAARVPGLVAAYLSAMAQEHERAAGGWQSEWPTVAATVEATGSALAAMADTVRTLKVNTERMHANVGQKEIALGLAETFRRRLLEDPE